MKVPLETNSHCITCPTITERISERSNFDLLIDAESLPNENPLNDNLDSDTGFSKLKNYQFALKGSSNLEVPRGRNHRSSKTENLALVSILSEKYFSEVNLIIRN